MRCPASIERRRLTAYHDDEQLFHALKAGAAAYYPKNVDPRTLLSAIRAVHSGNYVIGEEVMAKPQVAAWLLKQFEELVVFDESPSEMFAPLSDARDVHPATDRRARATRRSRTS